MLLSVVLLRAVRVLAGSVVGDALVVSARGSRSQVVNRAVPPVGLVQVVLVIVWLMRLVRVVWLLCHVSVALVTVMVVRSGLVPVVMVRVSGTLGGSALLGCLLATPGGRCRWCRCW